MKKAAHEKVLAKALLQPLDPAFMHSYNGLQDLASGELVSGLTYQEFERLRQAVKVISALRQQPGVTDGSTTDLP